MYKDVFKDKILFNILLAHLKMEKNTKFFLNRKKPKPNLKTILRAGKIKTLVVWVFFGFKNIFSSLEKPKYMYLFCSF